MNTNNKQLISQFRLPSYVSGKSFADASKLINSKFEGRNDMVSNNTKNELLKRLSEAQEYLKSQEQVEQSNQMALGGQLQNNQLENAIGEAAYMGADAIAPGAGQVLKLGDQLGESIGDAIGGDTGESWGGALGATGNLKGMGSVLKTGNINDIPLVGIFGGQTTKQKEKLKQANELATNTNRQLSDNYFAMGGDINTSTEPDRFRYAVGEQSGVQHGTSGKSGYYLYYGKKPGDAGFNPNKHREFVTKSGYNTYMNSPQGQQYRRNIATNTQQPIEQFAMGGNINQFDNGGPLPENYKNLNILNNYGENSNQVKSIQDYKKLGYHDYKWGDANSDGVVDSKDIIKEKTFGQKIWDNTKKVGKVATDNSDLLRYAPAVTNALQLAKLKKPAGVRLDKLGNRYTPDYLDLAQQQNIVNQELNNTNSAIQQSGASQGQSRAAILGAQLNKTRALSGAYANAQVQNAQQNATAQQFNLGVDQTNLSQSNLQQDINDRNIGNYDTQKSKLQSQIGTDLGNIGKEELFRKYPERMGLMYDNKGRAITEYQQGKDGKYYHKKTGEEYKPLEQNKKAKGGYLNSDVLSHINNMYMKRNNK